LRDWAVNRPTEYTEGVSLVKDFLSDKKLVRVDDCIMSTNFYLVKGSRVRPVFPCLNINRVTKVYLDTNSFRQKLMTTVILRGRTHKSESAADITDAFMSISITKRLSSVLGLKLPPDISP
jgi:hypothetical protein